MFTPLLRHRSVPSLLRPVCPVPCLTKPRFFTNSPVLAGRFFGIDDELQKPSCSFVQTLEEGILFLERRSANRQLYDISCENRDPRFVYRIGTALICSFKNTWLDAAGLMSSQSWSHASAISPAGTSPLEATSPVDADVVNPRRA